MEAIKFYLVGIYFPLKGDSGSGIAIYRNNACYYYAEYEANYSRIRAFKEIPNQKFLSMKYKMIFFNEEKQFSVNDDAQIVFVLSFKKGSFFCGNKYSFMENATELFLKADSFKVKEQIVCLTEKLLPLMAR